MGDEVEVLQASAPLPPRTGDSEPSDPDGIVALSQLLAEKAIAPEKASRLRASFLALQRAVEEAQQREAAELQRAKNLNQELQIQRAELERNSDPVLTDKSVAGELRRELLKAANEGMVVASRESALRDTLDRLTEERKELAAELERIDQGHKGVDPEVIAVKNSMATVQLEINQRKTELEHLQTDKSQRVKRLQEAHAANAELEEEEKTLQQQLVVVGSEPGRIQKQSNVFASGAKQVSGKLEEVQSTHRKLEEEWRARQMDKTGNLRIMEELENEEVEIEGKTETELARGQSLHRRLQAQRDLQAQALGDKALLATQIQVLKTEVKANKDTVLRRERERDVGIRSLHQAEIQEQHIRDQVQGEEKRKAEVSTLLEIKRREAQDIAAITPKLEKDVKVMEKNWEASLGASRDISAQALKTSGILRSLADVIASEKKEVYRLALVLRQAETNLEQSITECKRISLQTKQITEKVENIGIEQRACQKTMDSLTSAHGSVDVLYQVVTHEKNQCAQQIHVSKQHQEEMREKTMVLESEVEVLRASALTKDAKLLRQRQDNASNEGKRDKIRAELNQLLLKSQELAELQHNCTLHNQKLLDGIEKAEKQLLSMRDHHQVASKERQNMGHQLLDRQEELVSLYEKLNIQDAKLRTGGMILAEREEEERFLRLSIGDLQREVVLLKKLLPQKETLERDLVNAQIELLSVQESCAKLEEQLQAPENKERTRVLDKKDLSVPELQVKIEDLATKLALKEEKSIEKDLVLDETLRLLARAQQQLGTEKGESFDLAKSINEHQSRIKAVTRSLMATVSELSMYQSQAIQLQQEVHEKENELKLARERMEAGLAPSTDAEEEWQKQERQRILKQKFALQEQQSAEEGSITARPNSYMPSIEGALPIPKPFGALAPVKPPIESANMRHIRKPATNSNQAFGVTTSF